MGMSLATRAQVMPASQIRKLVPFADQAKARGTHVYHLNIGQPDIATPPPVLDALRAFDSKVVAYCPSKGHAAYLDSLLGYYERLGISLNRNQINVTTGGSEAVLFSFLTLLNPGDEVLIPEPFYTNYNGFACMTGVRVVPITTSGEDGFHLPSKEAIAARITPKTRAILLCNPSNPTGAVYTRDEIDRVAELVLQHNLWFLCDEVYREFVFEPKEGAYRSVLEIESVAQQTVVLDSLSKRFSLCGARLGCLICRNEEVMQAVLKFAQARLSSPQVAQIMATAAHSLPSETIPQMVDEYRKRRDVVYTALQEMEGVRVSKPEGAFYLIPKLPIEDSEHFAKWLLTEFSVDGKTVMVAPASGFYATPGLGLDEIRIAYVLNTDELKHSMELLKEALRVYNR